MSIGDPSPIFSKLATITLFLHWTKLRSSFVMVTPYLFLIKFIYELKGALLKMGIIPGRASPSISILLVDAANSVFAGETAVGFIALTVVTAMVVVVNNFLGRLDVTAGEAAVRFIAILVASALGGVAAAGLGRLDVAASFAGGAAVCVRALPVAAVLVGMDAIGLGRLNITAVFAGEAAVCFIALPVAADLVGMVAIGLGRLNVTAVFAGGDAVGFAARPLAGSSTPSLICRPSAFFSLAAWIILLVGGFISDSLKVAKTVLLPPS
jgi:hypothetical protein